MSKQSTRWVSGSDVIPMFPTLVWKIELESQLRKAIDAKAVAALVRMRRRSRQEVRLHRNACGMDFEPFV